MKSTNKRNDQGAGMVEMALTVALITIVCVASVQAVGKHVSDKYQNVAEELNCGVGSEGCNVLGEETPIPEIP